MLSGKHVIVVLTLLATAVGAGCSREEDSSGAPSFELPTLDGGSRDFAQRDAEVLIINFWASWCGPCRKEMPDLNTLYQRYRDQGLRIWGISVDTRATKARAFADEVDVEFPLLHDPKMRVSDDYDVKAMPSTFVIGPDGRIRHTQLGYEPSAMAELEEVTRTLLSNHR